MPSCVVKGCRNYDTKVQKKHGISYHRFPHDPVRKEIWCRIIREQREEPYFKPHKNTRVCSAHFCDKDFDVSKAGLQRLKDSALPQLFESKVCKNVEQWLSVSTPAPSLRPPSLQLGPSSSQVSNLSQKYGSPYQSAVSCVYGSGSGAESPLPEHTAPSGDGKHTQLKQQVKRKRSGDPAARQPESLACSECGSRVAARVYVCVQCVDARMCAACEPHAHASHAVVRLPSTRVYNIVRDLFESLQAQLNCRLRGLDDDAEDELTDDIDDDELDQYVNPVVKKTKRPVVASSAGQQIMPHEASKVTFKSSPPASPMPTDETNEPMVTADDIKVEDDYDEWEPLRETATEGFMKITSDIVKSECNEGTVAESKLAVDVRGDDKYNEMNLSKCLENESEFKRVSNVTVVRKTKGNTAGINKPAVKLETTENTSIECAQANELGSQIAVKIKEEPTEDACTEQVDSTGFLVIGSPRSIKVEDKETS
ncbi:uncharacterized protein LOC105381188 isoform X3 [Plutella xylostella]|uniref:uncharacterized protein LOC105381188 isoform X3 n=1 Tax=Plutella xylostella TaxID=51655 RepID=UPI002032D074|nr:uncharacterized protein LOC105381188 isoform X3 [Plutella xylostella]